VWLGFVSLPARLPRKRSGMWNASALLRTARARCGSWSPVRTTIIFYRALHDQNTGARDRFKEIMARWQHDRDGHVVGRRANLPIVKRC
jgi:hypothetical protein